MKCPFCGSKRLNKQGHQEFYRLHGKESYLKQKYYCRDCHRCTVRPDIEDNPEKM